MKACSHCKKSKPLDEFHRERRSPDGRRAICKSCRSVENQYPRVVVLASTTVDSPEEEFKAEAKRRALDDLVLAHSAELADRITRHEIRHLAGKDFMPNYIANQARSTQ